MPEESEHSEEDLQALVKEGWEIGARFRPLIEDFGLLDDEGAFLDKSDGECALEFTLDFHPDDGDDMLPIAQIVSLARELGCPCDPATLCVRLSHIRVDEEDCMFHVDVSMRDLDWDKVQQKIA